MKREQWSKVKSVFATALEHSEESRPGFVQQQCGAEPEIRLEVERLLDEHARVDGFLEEPTDLTPVKLALDASRGMTETMLGEFELFEEIGKGAMGRVYRARQASLNRDVAVKVMQPHLTLSERQVERFRLEATAAARLRHDNIVQVHAVGEADGIHYFAMDLVQGLSLHEILSEMRDGLKPEGVAAERFPEQRDASFPALVAHVVAELAAALEFSHNNGIVHRDVKPGNILVDQRGRPHIADFGLAKDLELESLFHSGQVVGTPYYMSPEQARPRNAKLDHRTDIFSLGVVLYEFLTLERPFEGETPADVMKAIREQEPVPVRRLSPRVPKDLETICLKALEKDPERRYQSSDELGRDLSRFLNHESIEARPPSSFERVRRFVLRNRALLLLIAVSTLTLVCGWILALNWTASETLTEQMGQLNELRDDPDLEQRGLGELVAGLDLSRKLLARPGQLDREQEAIARKTLERVEEIGDQSLHQLREGARDPLLAAALARTESERDTELSGLKSLAQAALLSSEESRRGALLADDLFHPRISLRALRNGSEFNGARVLLLPIDPTDGRALGNAVELGTTPIEEQIVAPGYYRIIATAGADAYGEVSRVISDPVEATDLQIHLAALPSSADMIRIEAGEFVTGSGPNDPIYTEHTETLVGFWIDRFAVSNARYREFVEATGWPAPRYWKFGYDPRWDRLPVVHVSAYDAEAYAAWRGCRLPTMLEWERAARHVDGRWYPWGGRARESQESVAARANIQDIKEPISSDDEDEDLRAMIELYIAHARPVDEAGQDISPDGMHHSLGNVREWTETLFRTNNRAGDQVIDPDQRITKAGSWKSPARHASLRSIGPAPATITVFDLGFRCARSLEP